MNKKTEKILIGIGLGILGIFGITKLVKAYKKGLEEIEEQEFQETEDLENAGVDTGKLKKQIGDEEADFAKMLFAACYFNADFDIDLFDPDEIREVLNEGKTIHVRQNNIDTKHGSKRFLDFLVEIPDYTENSYRGPKIGSFLTTIPDTAKHMWENIIRFTEKPRQILLGYVVVVRESDGEFSREYKQLKKVVYSQYADDKHDGLTKFYSIEKTKLKTTSPEDYIKDSGWLFENCPELDPNDESLYVENIVLMYKISFQIRSNRPGEELGIDTKTAVECIKYLTNDMYIQREGSNYQHMYDHVIFHALDDDTGESNLSWFYTCDDNDDIGIETWTE